MQTFFFLLTRMLSLKTIDVILVESCYESRGGEIVAIKFI